MTESRGDEEQGTVRSREKVRGGGELKTEDVKSQRRETVGPVSGKAPGSF